ncbi:MAG: HAD-IIB family hydrolase [Amphritea sp.]|nr:HAD-IIB family hydrolase [Amphritea sp.]
MNNLNLPGPLPESLPDQIRYLFTDVDDTLTWNGQLPPEAFSALQQLRDAGIEVIPVTGACYAWCDCMLRTWPIRTIIGENGAFWMMQDDNLQVTSHFRVEEQQRFEHHQQLKAIAAEALETLPFAKITEDSRFRLTDIAFDVGQQHCNSPEEQRQLMDFLDQKAITARLSSIHINIWMGDYDKAGSCLAYLEQHANMNLAEAREQVAFIGDSANDESMFRMFTHTAGVANIARFIPRLDPPPRYIAQGSGGYGFAEFASVLLGTPRDSEGKQAR